MHTSSQLPRPIPAFRHLISQAVSLSPATRHLPLAETQLPLQLVLVASLHHPAQAARPALVSQVPVLAPAAAPNLGLGPALGQTLLQVAPVRPTLELSEVQRARLLLDSV